MCKMKGSKPKCQLVNDDCLNDLKGEIARGGVLNV